MKIQGKYNSAEIYTERIDQETLRQLYNMLNNPCLADSNIAIMPDVHCGKGSVVGFTMTFNNYINPNVIGSDIGCGVSAYNIGKIEIDLEAFDRFIYDNIPAGTSIHQTIQKQVPKSDHRLLKLIQKVGPDEQERVLLSIGTLGGGNHFIELDQDESQNMWLVIHSGSRNFGKLVCSYHQNVAKKAMKEKYQGASAFHGMEFLTYENGAMAYFEDMLIAQEYAETNRATIAQIIIENYFRQKPEECELISSIHNYLNDTDKILRKGAISAQKDEKVIIPLNMRDGCLIATGKGNRNWNYSAPHGAGRLIKRGEIKELITLEEYQEAMKGIYSSCINQSTISESPMAYKDAAEITDYIKDTVEIESVMKPIYNFKA